MTNAKQDIERLLASGKTIQIQVLSGSMYPIIRPKQDEVIIEPLKSSEQLRRGEVALYRRDQSVLVLHRIFRHRDGQVFMVGDNHCEIEGPLREDQFRGILVGIQRSGKVISVKNPVYFVLSRLWLSLRPVRPFFWKTMAILRKVASVFSHR